MPQDNTVLMEGVPIIFRNFRGEGGPYNKEGDRNFAVKLSDDIANALLEDGWNVKYLKPREEDEDGVMQPYLPVSIRFDIFPPNVFLVTSRGRTRLDERQLDLLDWAEITNVDLIVRPHHWEVPPGSGKTGIKAYVKSMYVTIQEDALELKYAEMDEARTE